MRKRQIGSADWTPRERVLLWLGIAGNRDWVPNADTLLTSLRLVIHEQDCRADPITPDWRLPAK